MSGYLRFHAAHPALSNVAEAMNEAGDAFHNTSQWQDKEDCFDGKTACEVVQAAFDAADKALRDDIPYAEDLAKFIKALPCPNPQCQDGSIISTGPDPQNDACEWCYMRHMTLEGRRGHEIGILPGRLADPNFCGHLPGDGERRRGHAIGIRQREDSDLHLHPGPLLCRFCGKPVSGEAVTEDAGATWAHDHCAKAENAGIRSEVGQWMIDNGYATGHGDTVADLLQHLVREVQERRMILSQGKQDDLCVFGWYDHFNGEFVARPEEAKRREGGGNKVTPLYASVGETGVEVPRRGFLEDTVCPRVADRG